MQLCCIFFVSVYKGFMTDIHKTIQHLFETLQRPLSVPEIQELLAHKNLHPHKTTLYRIIEKMVQEGGLREVSLEAQTRYYEQMDQLHHHFVCDQCHRVKCLPDILLEKDLESAAQHLLVREGIAPASCSWTLHGLCTHCISS